MGNRINPLSRSKQDISTNVEVALSKADLGSMHMIPVVCGEADTREVEALVDLSSRIVVPIESKR